MSPTSGWTAELKGKLEPVPAWGAVVTAGPGPARAQRDPLIGRSEEADLLVAWGAR